MNGYAVKDATGIRINTVAETRQAALLNWLCVYGGLRVSNRATEAQIEDAFKQFQETVAPELLEVVAIEARELLH